ncbi:MAG TPA: DUF438 domain-containing protein [Myxococcota bacterium]|nr:DUF438 domain-containing protein [Myxococcota bacterium]HQK51853.1 DUF438 domain-containing protein [Myxococcota bacterium]
MSELLEQSDRRKNLLKHMIRQLHEGVAPEAVRTQLTRLLGQVPYHEVVEVEQQLIQEGLPVEEVLRLCDIHAAVLQGAISQQGAKEPPPGHPAATFSRENEALRWEVGNLRRLDARLQEMGEDDDATEVLLEMTAGIHRLLDVEKHYQRKEHLLFPILERHGVTGPPTVMWGKHDETRALLRDAREALGAFQGTATAGELRSVAALVLRPAWDSVLAMTDREEEILLPMTMDLLSEAEWWEVHKGSDEIGYCLYDPPATWRPADVPEADAVGTAGDDRIRLHSGSFTREELDAILNTIPFDLTFVDRDDTVRYFTQGRERIFTRTRAILGRKVTLCHPPSSVHVVERILEALRSGKQDVARFWIEMRGRFIVIEYHALRNRQGDYLGCLEVSQDLTAKRALQGERRILQWDEDPTAAANAGAQEAPDEA